MREDEGEICGEINRLNWGWICQNLCIIATSLVRGMPHVFNKGISAEDIVQNLLIKFFSSDNHFGWDPFAVAKDKTFEEGMVAFLAAALRRRIIDEIRSHRRHTFMSIDSDNTGGDDAGGGQSLNVVRNLADCTPSVESNIYLAEVQQQIIKRLGSDAVAAGIIAAATELTGSGKVDQELAELVIDDPKATDQIVNARKRLHRKLRAWKDGSETWKPKPMNRAASPSLSRIPKERPRSEGFAS